MDPEQEREPEGSTPIHKLGEEGLVSRLVSQIPVRSDVLDGPGDDCAVVETAGVEGLWRLLKIDSIVEGVHFLPGTDPVRVGRKAMNRALSDIAAMGGVPFDVEFHASVASTKLTSSPLFFMAVTISRDW